MDVETYEIKLKSIEGRDAADWAGEDVRLDVYIDGERRDSLQQTIRRGDVWNLGETSYRYADHIQFQLWCRGDADQSIELGTFTIGRGATEPAGAEFEVANDHGTFVLVYNVEQVRSPGEPAAI